MTGAEGQVIFSSTAKNIMGGLWGWLAYFVVFR
jgi:hypothetical protein